MKILKVTSLIILVMVSMSIMVSGVNAAQDTAQWKFHVKAVNLGDTFTVAPSGFYIPEASFDVQYDKNYLNLVSKEGYDFTFKAIKPGIAIVNIIYIPWYSDRKTVTDTYLIIVKNPSEPKI